MQPTTDFFDHSWEIYQGTVLCFLRQAYCIRRSHFRLTLPRWQCFFSFTSHPPSRCPDLRQKYFSLFQILTMLHFLFLLRFAKSESRRALG